SAASGDCRVQSGRRRGAGPRRLLPGAWLRSAAGERDQHDARLYRDQHVSQAVAGQRHDLRAAGGAAGGAGRGAVRRTVAQRNELSARGMRAEGCGVGGQRSGMSSPSTPTPHPPLHAPLARGGSGGCATPVLAVAQALRERCPEVRFLYIGTAGGPEAELARAQNLEFAAIATGKLRRYWDVQNLVDPFRVLLGVSQAYNLARRFRPRVAFAA